MRRILGSMSTVSRPGFRAPGPSGRRAAARVPVGPGPTGPYHSSLIPILKFLLACAGPLFKLKHSGLAVSDSATGAKACP